MKLLISALFICIAFTTAKAQNYSDVDARVTMYPKQYASADQLARQIEADFTNDKDKVRAIYTWLAMNVAYDLETLYSGQTQINFSYSGEEDLQRKLAAINTSTVNKTLRSNKAICEGYAQTFKKVAEKMGIPCMLIGGFSKGDVQDIGDNPSEENHAWNAVKINRKWFLVDATWGAGYTNGNRWIRRFDDFFFLTDPDKFALTHFPSEPTWLLTSKQLTKQEFYETPIFEKAFFKHDLELLSPLKGRIFAKPNTTIKFTLGRIPEMVTLYYAFKGDTYSKKIEPTCNATRCTFGVPFTQNRNTELLIFANERNALKYKVTLKE